MGFRINPTGYKCWQVQGGECTGYGTDTFLLCVMFARLSELKAVLQGLIPEIILSHKCETVYVHMGPIGNGCRFRNSWSVAAYFTRDGVNSTRNYLWDRDNPHGTVGSKYQHFFAINVWCCVWWPTDWSVHFPAKSDRWYLRQHFANELSALLENVPLQTRCH